MTNENEPNSLATARRRRPRRGVLALLDEEPLPCYSYDATLVQESTRAMKRKRHSKRPTLDTSFALQELLNDNDNVEFTLFFLADSRNLNSIRFRPILVDFQQASHSECRCICIPNHEHNQDLLCAGTGFYCLPWTHPNRAAVLQLLAASEVPSVIVVENATGRRLTDQGMLAIEANDAQELLKRWKRHESGLSWGQTLQSSCHIS